MRLIQSAILIIVLMAIGGTGLSQTEVSDKLQAERLFEDNQYGKVISLADGLDKKKNSKAERVSIYEMAIRSSLEMGQLDKIDQYFKKLLLTDPFYEPAEEVVEERYMTFYQKYEALPQLVFGINMIVTQPIVNVENSYSVYEELDYASSEYETQSYSRFVAHLDFYPFKHHRFSINFANPQIGFSRTIQGNSTDTLDANYDVGPLKYEEVTQTYLGGINYGFYPLRTQTFGVGMIVGVSQYFARNSSGSATIQYQLGTPEYEESASPPRDRLSARNTNTTYFDLGLDAYFNTQKIGLNLGVHYFRARSLYNDPNERYSDDQLVYSYYYVDDDFFIDLLSFNAGISYNFTYRVK